MELCDQEGSWEWPVHPSQEGNKVWPNWFYQVEGSGSFQLLKLSALQEGVGRAAVPSQTPVGYVYLPCDSFDALRKVGRAGAFLTDAQNCCCSGGPHTQGHLSTLAWLWLPSLLTLSLCSPPIPHLQPHLSPGDLQNI